MKLMMAVALAGIVFLSVALTYSMESVNSTMIIGGLLLLGSAAAVALDDGGI